MKENQSELSDRLWKHIHSNSDYNFKTSVKAKDLAEATGENSRSIGKFLAAQGVESTGSYQRARLWRLNSFLEKYLAIVSLDETNSHTDCLKPFKICNKSNDTKPLPYGPPKEDPCQKNNKITSPSYPLLSPPAEGHQRQFSESYGEEYSLTFHWEKVKEILQDSTPDLISFYFLLSSNRNLKLPTPCLIH